MTRAYAGLFAAILLLLTVMVFLFAYQFPTKRQTGNLRTTPGLTGDHIVEEIEEGESLSQNEICNGIWYDIIIEI